MKRAIIIALGVVSLLPWVSAGLALALGIGVALVLGNPWPEDTRRIAHLALAWSVVGLGAGMNLVELARVGLYGFGYTAAGIAVALALGTLLGRALRVSRDLSLLVTTGTAICGGSAIAALAPAIRAKGPDISVALATVFLLNAVALYAFPLIGHHFHLQEDAFGLWCALAIHDTSSVVGAAAQYGPIALQVATAAKLARALWIVPLTLGIAALRRKSSDAATAKLKLPWFIGGFVIAAALVSYVPPLRPVGAIVSTLAHRSLAGTLYLIGLGLSRATLKALGFRPFAQALGLWIALASVSLLAITQGWIGN